MKVSVPPMTLEDLQRLPDDGNRYELIEGELYVSAAPRDKHQRLSMDFCDWLSPFAKKHKLGRVYHAAFDVFLDPGAQTCVEPDLIFISQERLHIVRDEGVFGPPDLVIEIVSESTYKTDMTTKLGLYRRTGVKEYWVAHPEERTILVYHFAESSEPRRLQIGDTLTTPLLPGLEIPLDRLFAGELPTL